MSTYNGWTNYATWRVNVEMLDNGACIDFSDVHDVAELAQHLNSFVHDYITENCDDILIQDYALAFLDDVNFQEIAEHLADDNELFTNKEEA